MATQIHLRGKVEYKSTRDMLNMRPLIYSMYTIRRYALYHCVQNPFHTRLLCPCIAKAFFACPLIVRLGFPYQM